MRRREVVKLGIMAIGCVGCGGGGGEETTPDAPGTTSGFEVCGTNICVSLMEPVNAALRDVNGARPINVPDKIIIVRTSATTFSVLSRVCTHNNCGVSYQPSSMELACPCHGSRFALNGAVTREPATRALKSYTHTFDETTQVLTITIA
ncbi:MAG: Rieske 2Fe-2S domain-containing protein [Myxococcota bacterium]|nr:Rieske 2Fe-2S domain-containing protein [Myxococcota bacterium]